MTSKGQGSLEYLLLIAAVVLIAAITMIILFSTSGSGRDEANKGKNKYLEELDVLEKQSPLTIISAYSNVSSGKIISTKPQMEELTVILLTRDEGQTDKAITAVSAGNNLEAAWTSAIISVQPGVKIRIAACLSNTTTWSRKDCTPWSAQFTVTPPPSQT